jgi:SET domain-containing protein
MDVTNPGSVSNSVPIELGNEFLEIRQSVIHGTGGYARRDIPAGTLVIEYVGERISKEESNRRCEAENEYIFTIDEQWDLDGKVSWNPARFINHSCEPNCEAEWDEGRIFINALRDIKRGEELTFNYNYDLEDYKAHPCRCGTRDCVGYIVAAEYFEQVRKAAVLTKTCVNASVSENLRA